MSSTKQYYRNIRSEMLTLLPARYATVLEVGCGEGNFLELLDDKAEKWGVEMDEESAAIAAPKTHRLLPGKYEDVQRELPQAYFDLAICNDVIEHMEDHDGFLESIRTKLRPGGYFVASLPNVRHQRHLFELLVLKDWRYRNHGILDRTHLRFFTQKSVHRWLTEHGFIVEELKGVNRSPQPVFRLLGAVAVLLTLGYYADVPYMQIAVRARRGEADRVRQLSADDR